MTPTLLGPAPAPPAGPGRRSRARTVLRALAIASCSPYLGLKTAWIAGSTVGIPAHSTLLDHRGAMIAGNSASVLLDACVIVLALLLTQGWGRRVPAWLPAFPMWVATGLLAPVMAGFPLQLLVRGLGGSTTPAAPRAPFLDGWVFGAVYCGFIVQGLTLGTLFVLYARDRWGHLWRGRAGELPTRTATAPVQRATAVAAALLALLPALMHTLWACGVEAGLSPARITDRTSDFYALEAVYAAFALVSAAGALLLAFRRSGRLPAWVPLSLSWTGSGALACWGAWLLISSLASSGPDAAQTQLMTLTYAVQMTVGLLVLSAGASFLAERDR
ncbi:hypothetical protein [Streptomyces sp. NBC_00859]|uniref:hypothetical protein n=1 Tax=Streptomyces sp. NBC_00859 TaxID=2903682 RepID=UPI00386FD7F5|nr:hypothetical protein OG584_27545 [Streptomyces sp. NBC_00859]